MYINKALLYGNLTRDPELRSLPSGIQVASFSLATNRVYNDKDGKRQEQADYHNIVVFGKQADTVSRYMKKGNGVFVEGRMQTRSWEQDGQKKYRTEVIADRVQFGPRSGGSSDGGGSYGGGSQSQSQSAPAPAQNTAPQKADSIEYPEEDINPDDIPF